MACELYNLLTDNCLLSGTGPRCRYEKSCAQTAEECKWGPLLRQVARNMAIEDTPEDLAHDAILASLEAKVKFDSLVQELRVESFIKSLVCIQRVN